MTSPSPAPSRSTARWARRPPPPSRPGVEQTGELDEETTLALQAWAKTSQDGVIGEDTVAGLQHEVGAVQNGSDEIDGDTVEVLQAFLNLY